MSDPRVVVKLFTSCASILMPDPLIQDVCDDTIAPLTWRAFCGVFVFIPTPDGALMMKELSCAAVNIHPLMSKFITQILLPMMSINTHIPILWFPLICDENADNLLLDPDIALCRLCIVFISQLTVLLFHHMICDALPYT